MLVVDRRHGAAADEATLEDALRLALQDRSVKEAAADVARRLGLLPEGGDNPVLDLDTHRKKRGR